jgi:hypothetical protein
MYIRAPPFSSHLTAGSGQDFSKFEKTSKAEAMKKDFPKEIASQSLRNACVGIVGYDRALKAQARWFESHSFP